jgi:hypothetical protein
MGDELRSASTAEWLAHAIWRDKIFSLIFLEVAYTFMLGVEPAEKVDVPGTLDFSGERLALVVLAYVSEVVSIVAKHAADGERSLPRGRKLVHALLVLYEP